jgi:predicted peroxiredoxin
MGLLDTLFGTASTAATVEETTATTDSYAVLLNAGPDDAPTASNAFNYALELDDAGYEVQLFLDGEATRWPSAFAENPDLPFRTAWERVRERGLLAGACGYCANAFDVATACEQSGIELLSDKTEHAPAVPELADDGYEMLTIG